MYNLTKDSKREIIKLKLFKTVTHKVQCIVILKLNNPLSLYYLKSEETKDEFSLTLHD